MNQLGKIFFVCAILMSAQAASAQTDTTETAEPAADPAGGLDMGQEVGQENGIGQLYVRETFNDWQVRCVRTENESDPCQVHQILSGEEGNAVAEVSIFPLPADAQAAAGATIAVPLMTLLTEQLTLAVDSAPAKRYQFSWCDRDGCYARVGFTESDIASFKGGANATVRIVPVAAPDQEVTVSMSLSGFTAAFDSLSSN